MKPWVTVARADKGDLLLQERDGEFVIRSGGQVLMSSREHGSEEMMPRAAFGARAGSSSKVLIGGLGLGFTLRATLDVLPADAKVVVAEISEAVVMWNRGVLSPLAKAPLEDSRVTVVVADVAEVIRGPQGPFDAILLDVDNGPRALGVASNQALYAPRMLSQMHKALRPGGAVVVWSAAPDEVFLKRLGDARFRAETIPVKPRAGSGRAPHTLFVARV